ncbi:hypothetical protein [Anatilimnocola floriformis]|uniref:hypothetical protein n=1 Tax=Anatilimnocola floriformis TaxID=2948575 RepID=UPI0020C45A59|nr:hypothetical protein [Anatilimnocola floriformis]
MATFNDQSARRIAKAVRIVEKLTKNKGGLRRPLHGGEGGFWAKIGEREDKRYSWKQVHAVDDDKLEEDEENFASGDKDEETGYAIEAMEKKDVPEDSIVWLQPGITKDYYVFKYSDAVPGLIRFQLQEDLTLGGHARAIPLKLSHPSSSYIADDDADEIEVYDIFRRNFSGTSIEGIASPGMWAGFQYMWGWAQQRTGSTDYVDSGESESTSDDEKRVKYDIVWMEQIAERIMFMTTGPVHSEGGGLAVEAQVIRFDGQGISPVEVIANDEEDHITIHVPFFFQDSLGSNAYGLAEYDYSERKYYITEVMRVAIFATATITEKLCGDEFPSNDVDISGFSIIPHGWHQMNPPATPTKAQNSYGHAGPSGSKVLLLRVGLDSLPIDGDNDSQKYRWEIVNIYKRQMNVIFDLTWGLNDDVEMAVQYKERVCRMEWCDPDTPEAWQTLVTAKNCDGTED